MTSKQITVGQDSFLDIVANLVGILIILVVVVGAQAKIAWDNVQPEPELTSQSTTLKDDIEKTDFQITKMEKDNQELERRIQYEVQMTRELSARRHEILVRLELERKAIANQENRLDIEKQKKLSANVKLTSLQQQLSQVKAETSSLQNVATRREPIEHYPTPIAKTVFSDEIHFRIINGKISFVPLEELVEMMKSEWEYAAETLHDKSLTKKSVGPIRGFRLQYELESQVAQNVSYGRSQRSVRFKKFVLLPTQNAAGETVDATLFRDSQFLTEVTRLIPAKTTVSIWTYPDSYSELNRVKKWLRENGFQIATWPLGEGKLISGGPNGFQTSAQ